MLAWLGVGATEDRFGAIVRLCMVFVAVGVIKAAVEFGNYLLALWIRVRAGAAVQMDLFRHLMNLSMSFFTRHRTGELVSRLDNDTRAATAGLEIIVGQLLTAPVLIAVYGILLVRTSPRLVFAAAAAFVLHWLITRAVRGPIRRLATDQFSVFAELVARFQEAILSIRVVKSFGAEAFEASRVRRTLAEVLRVNVKFGIYKHAEQPARTIVNYVIEMGILADGRVGAPRRPPLGAHVLPVPLRRPRRDGAGREPRRRLQPHPGRPRRVHPARASSSTCGRT